MSYDRESEPTLASTWHAASGGAIAEQSNNTMIATCTK